MENEFSDTYSLFAEFYDSVQNYTKYLKWQKFIEEVWSQNDLSPESLLDIACGTGSNSVLYSKKGLDVEGLDISREMLVKAKKKIEEDNLNIKLRNESFLDFNLERKFDAAICLDFSTNHILSEKDFAKFINNVYNSLKKGGIFIFDFKPLKDFKRKFDSLSTFTKFGNFEYSWTTEYDLPYAYLTLTLRDLENNKEYSSVSKERFFSLEEIKKVIFNSNFNLIGIYDDYSFQKPDDSSKFWVFVLQK